MPLTLTRKVGEVIRIGDDVAVKVTLIDGNRVRLQVTAPRETRILREELVVTGKETPKCRE